MSGTNDKNNLFGNKVDKRTAREEQASLAKKKMRTATVVVLLVVAVFFAGARFINSDYIRRTVAAVTVGDRDFSAAEYEYFFRLAHFNYRNHMAQIIDETVAINMGILPIPGFPLRSQLRDTGETWAEYISNIAVMNMAELVSLYNAARARGYVLRDESRQSMNEQIDTMRQAAQTGNISFRTYLQLSFGRSMNESTFLELMEFIFTANSFSDYMFESFIYSAEELEDFYNRNCYSFDNFTYRSFFIPAEDFGTEADFESAEEFEAAREAALDEARQTAQRFADEITTQEEFIDAAFEFDPEMFEDADAATWRMAQGEQIFGAYSEWIWDTARRYGDVTAFETATGAFVLFFVNRDMNEYYMAEMRQILIMREQIMEFLHETTDDDGLPMLDEESFNAAVAVAEAEANRRAQNVYNLFVEGGATEDALIALMDEYSDDWAEGGLYVDITKIFGMNKMVPEIEDWLFAPERQIGDFELIRTEAIGYHLVFFSGFGDRVRDFIADSRMRGIDHGEWRDSLPAPEASIRWGQRLVQL